MAKKDIDIILDELRLDYLDLCLIHWPQGYEESGEFFPKVELHPYFQQRKLYSFCQEHGIVVTAYSPLANPAMPFRKATDAVLLDDPVILKLAEVYHKSSAQVVLRWGIQRGLVVIPKSVTEKRIIENIKIFDFELKPDEMALINGLDKNWRILDLSRDADHPFFPFNEEY
ncbi:oxidoreductase [Wuchereria bancrofti]|uniref:Oxidoreductase n=1 Tax=Wuchereria bancrofti TaxID=6293 RepID=J9DZ87_WUCBA|nr:oxidoreductase [Wuchereria bancrofti]